MIPNVSLGRVPYSLETEMAFVRSASLSRNVCRNAVLFSVFLNVIAWRHCDTEGVSSFKRAFQASISTINKDCLLASGQ